MNNQKNSNTKAAKLSESEEVELYMKKLVHPLKAEIEALRKIIRNSNTNISERIKWNAPSYYAKEDLVTFNHRDQKRVHLVFHHKEIVNVKSGLLEGDYKDRRMMYFNDMKDVKAKKGELENIMNKLVALVNK